MTLSIALTNSPMTHGAQLLTGSPRRTVNGLAVVRLGDPVLCPLKGHGLNSIVAVFVTQQTDGLPVAHSSAVAACGATIITGSPDTYVG